MGDLSKERIAELRLRIRVKCSDYTAAGARGAPAIEVDANELAFLLDMAARSVTENTLRMLSNALLAKDGRLEFRFQEAAFSDLKEAAEALGRKG